MSKLRDEAEKIVSRHECVINSPIKYPDKVLEMHYRQAKRVLILLDALEKIADGEKTPDYAMLFESDYQDVIDDAKEAIKQAEEV